MEPLFIAAAFSRSWSIKLRAITQAGSLQVAIPKSVLKLLTRETVIHRPEQIKRFPGPVLNYLICEEPKDGNMILLAASSFAYAHARVYTGFEARVNCSKRL